MINQCQMTKFQCQMNVKVYISNLNFVIWILFELCLPAAGRDFGI